MWELICEECGEGFESRRNDSRFCSSSCRQSAYRKREKIEPNELETDQENVEYLEDESINFEENSQQLSNISNEDIDAQYGLSKADLLQIQVNGYFSHFVVHLRNTYDKKTKLSYLEEILVGLEDLKTQFQRKGMLLYAQYIFVDELEYLISELSSFIHVSTKNKPHFIVNESFGNLLEELPVHISENTQLIREQYG